MKKWLILMWHRLWSETPHYFKKLVHFMVSLTALGVALMGMETLYPDLFPTEWLGLIKKISAVCILIGIVGAWVAKQATMDTDLQNNNLPNG